MKDNPLSNYQVNFPDFASEVRFYLHSHMYGSLILLINKRDPTFEYLYILGHLIADNVPQYVNEHMLVALLTYKLGKHPSGSLQDELQRLISKFRVDISRYDAFAISWTANLRRFLENKPSVDSHPSIFVTSIHMEEGTDTAVTEINASLYLEHGAQITFKS